MLALRDSENDQNGWYFASKEDIYISLCVTSSSFEQFGDHGKMVMFYLWFPRGFKAMQNVANKFVYCGSNLQAIAIPMESNKQQASFTHESQWMLVLIVSKSNY